MGWKKKFERGKRSKKRGEALPWRAIDKGSFAFYNRRQKRTTPTRPLKSMILVLDRRVFYVTLFC